MRFRRKITRTMEMADAQISEARFPWAGSLPSILRLGHARSREGRPPTLAARFAVFPADIRACRWEPPSPTPTRRFHHPPSHHLTIILAGLRSSIDRSARLRLVGWRSFEATFRLPTPVPPTTSASPLRNPDASRKETERSSAVLRAMSTGASRSSPPSPRYFFPKPYLAAAGEQAATRPAMLRPRIPGEANRGQERSQRQPSQKRVLLLSHRPRRFDALRDREDRFWSG